MAAIPVAAIAKQALVTEPAASTQPSSTLLALPVELWEENIRPRLDAEDLIALSKTCKAFRIVLAPIVSRQIAYHPHTSSWFGREHAGGRPLRTARRSLTNFVQRVQWLLLSRMSTLVQAMKFGEQHVSASEDMPSNRPSESWHLYELLSKKRQSWDLLALDFALPLLQQFVNLREVTFFEVDLQRAHIEAVLLLARLKSLSFIRCSVAFPDTLPSSPPLQLDKLRVEDPVKLEYHHFMVFFINPDLNELHVLDFVSDELRQAVAEACPMPRLKVAAVGILGSMDLATISRIFPNVVELDLRGFALRSEDEFPLPPSAFPCLVTLATSDVKIVELICESHSVQNLRIEIVGDDSVSQLVQVLLGTSRGVQCLKSLSLLLSFAKEEHPLLALLDAISLKSAALECLDMHTEYKLFHYLQKAKVPLHLRSFTLLADSARHPLHKFTGEEMKAASIALLRHMCGHGRLEYLKIHTPYGFTLTYDRDTFGPLSKETYHRQYSCRLE